MYIYIFYTVFHAEGSTNDYRQPTEAVKQIHS